MLIWLFPWFYHGTNHTNHMILTIHCKWAITTNSLFYWRSNLEVKIIISLGKFLEVSQASPLWTNCITKMWFHIVKSKLLCAAPNVGIYTFFFFVCVCIMPGYLLALFIFLNKSYWQLAIIFLYFKGTTGCLSMHVCQWPLKICALFCHWSNRSLALIWSLGS